MTLRPRQPHASTTDRAVRREKARKITEIVKAHHPLEGVKLLEVGCGSGYMSEYFAEVVRPGTVNAVDRVDLRQTMEGYTFTPVVGSQLPFPDAEFDVVISNHVMEHVGDIPDQINHLCELRRVLRPSGVAYVAVPNRWRVVEPHFHLPFLSWLPPGLASRYVRATGRGEWYDVVPPSQRRMTTLFSAADLDWTDVTLASMETMRAVETLRGASRLAVRLPGAVLRAGIPWIPTMIFIARPGPDEA